jgi:signal transduction histidine kinase/DNA-binding response OmpR family regulator
MQRKTRKIAHCRPFLQGDSASLESLLDNPVVCGDTFSKSGKSGSWPKVNKILVVDDDRLLRTMAEDLLVRNGLEVWTARSGEECLAALKEQAFDAVLLDLILPDHNGLDLLPRIHQASPDLPVVIMTAYASLDSAVAAIKKGAYDYITKPLDPVLLGNSIDKALASYDLVRSNRELIQRLESRVQRLELVNQVGMAVTATRQFDQLTGLACETLGRLFKCEVQLWLRHSGSKRLVRCDSGDDPGLDMVNLARRVLEEGVPLCLDRDFPAMIAPLVVGTRPIGVMGVSRTRGQRSFDPEDFEIYKALVSFLAIATENARLTSDLQASKQTVEEYSLTLEAKVRKRTIELEQRHNELQTAHTRLVQTSAHLEQSNRQLRETRDRLLSQEKMASLGVVAAGVAHEINNPIGFVNSNLESLGEYLQDLQPLLRACGEHLGVEAAARDPREQLAALRQELTGLDLEFLLDDLPKLVEESRQGIARVSKIVLDLKVFSRQDNWEMVPADINGALESALNIAWNQLKYKTEVKKEFGILPPIRCAPNRLSQVFLNLLVNAAQAIETRGVLRVRSRALPDRVRVMVADTGSGIPPELRKRILDPFFTTKRPGEGTGLGLSLAYEIVKRHGGSLRVRSLPGRGTCMVVDLPLAAGGLPTGITISEEA